VRVTAIIGFLVGAAVSRLHWSQFWPELNWLALWRGAGLGWLAGIVLSAPLVYILSRRASGSRAGPRPRWRQVAGVVLTALAMAPLALWLTMALPGGLMRKAMAAGRRPGDSRPNLLLITIDALRTDHVGAYGSTAGLTSNLDAFAQEATRYDAAYVSSPWTLMSFGAIFTSRPPSECGLKVLPNESAKRCTFGQRLSQRTPLLSEKLAGLGYATAAELTNRFLDSERGWARGFDCYRNESSSESSPREAALAQPVTQHAREWLSLNRREPFFLWVHYLDLHGPHETPGMREKLESQYPEEWAAGRLQWLREMRSEEQATRSRYQEFCRGKYAEGVRYVDRWVGELLEEIRAAGIYDDSLIVITADHGEELFDHGGFEHGHSMHEEVLAVPLLVKWPKGVAADRWVGQTVAVMDLGHTFLEFAEAPEASRPGWRSLPRRDGAQGTEVYAEGILYGDEQTALITDDYKVIYHPHDSSAGGRFEVYDRRTDRQERHDLADTGAAGELCARLKKRTEAAQAAAVTWYHTAEKESRELTLSEKAKRDLRSLGYVGE